MSTRANILLVKRGDDAVYQYYHHCDGYLSGVGNELRKFIRISNYACEVFLSDMPDDEIGFDRLNVLADVLRAFGGEDEYESENDPPHYLKNVANAIHGDIEYLYLIEDVGDAMNYYFLPLRLVRCEFDPWKDHEMTYSDVITDIVTNGIQLPASTLTPFTDLTEENLIKEKNSKFCPRDKSMIDAFKQVLSFIDYYKCCHTDSELVEELKQSIETAIKDVGGAG